MILFLDLASRFARAQPRSSSTAAWTAVEPIGGRSTPRLPASGTLYSQSSPQTQRQGSAEVPQEPNTPVQLRSLGAGSAPSELLTSQRTARDSFHLSARPSRCARPRARLLCRCRSHRGGDPAAPPWGRSRWSGRMSLGRCAPGAASGRHTCQRWSATRSPRAKEGAAGGGAARTPCGCG